MRFLYLVQSASINPYPMLKHILCLTYKDKHPDYIYLSNSTWTTGRNRLLEEAKKMANNGDVYDYYIFLDEDIIWINGSWEELETRLTNDKPMIATTKLRSYKCNNGPNIPIFMYDHCLTIYSKNAIFNTDILPYDDRMDEMSWYYSAHITIYRVLYMFKEHEKKYYHDLIYDGTQHNIYPKEYIEDKCINHICKYYMLQEKSKYLPYNVSSFKYLILRESMKKLIKVKQHNNAIIITTINQPTKCIYRVIEWCKQHTNEYEKWTLIIVGDRKTPDVYHKLDCIYLDIQTQEKLYPQLCDILPYNHYCRKNIGYLYAINNKYDKIAETDDDNYFTEDWNNFRYDNYPAVVGDNWVNIFKQYTNKHIWPRGCPYEHINTIPQLTNNTISERDVAVIQGIVDGEPDVDAVYRLARATSDGFTFDKYKTPVAIANGTLTPFNSQNTIWLSNFEYMYLPCTVSFRYTDILRSYVANFGLWSNNKHIVYTPTTAIQERNEHNIIHDLNDEISMYKTWYDVENIGRQLKDVNLLNFYQDLANKGIVMQKELEIIKIWNKLIKL